MTSINIKFHAITRSDISEVLKFVEDAYYQGDVHFLDYEKESVDNVINNIGPKKYTRTSEEDILQMIENKNGTLIGARIDNNSEKNGDIVACAFVEKCDLKYAELHASQNPCKIGYVCTHLNYQKLGLGEKIMNQIFNVVREKGYDEVIISVIDHKDWLKKWYSKKFGFQHYKNLTEEWPKPVSCFVREKYKESTKFALMRVKV
jgi:predicted GNAT family N-acyltransferase